MNPFVQKPGARRPSQNLEVDSPTPRPPEGAGRPTTEDAPKEPPLPPKNTSSPKALSIADLVDVPQPKPNAGTLPKESMLLSPPEVVATTVQAIESYRLTKASLQDWVDAAPHESHRRYVQTMILQSSSEVDGALVTKHLKLAKSMVSTLPEGLYIEGDFSIDGCEELEALPDGLVVGGDLSVAECPLLQTLPEGLYVGGDLDLAAQPNHVTSLPLGITIGGQIIGASRLINLPDGLALGGDVDLSAFSQLQELPENLSIGGDFRFGFSMWFGEQHRLNNIEALPKGLKVGGVLDLREEFSRVRIIPEDVQFGELRVVPEQICFLSQPHLRCARVFDDPVANARLLRLLAPLAPEAWNQRPELVAAIVCRLPALFGLSAIQEDVDRFVVQLLTCKDTEEANNIVRCIATLPKNETELLYVVERLVGGSLRDAARLLGLIITQHELKDSASELGRLAGSAADALVEDWCSISDKTTRLKQVEWAVASATLLGCAEHPPKLRTLDELLHALPAVWREQTKQAGVLQLARRLRHVASESDDSEIDPRVMKMARAVIGLIFKHEKEADALETMNRCVDALPGNAAMLKKLSEAGYRLGNQNIESAYVLASGNPKEHQPLVEARQHAGEYADFFDTVQPIITELLAAEDPKSFGRKHREVKAKLTKIFADDPRKLNRIAQIAKETEEALERRQVSSAAPVSFKVVMHQDFWSTVGCCSESIPGCYAPNGDHAERPLEIGMRRDQALLSIRNARGKEVESLEVEFYPEGMVVLTPYSRSHGFRTEMVWAQFLCDLVTQGIVPAVILPTGPSFTGTAGSALTQFLKPFCRELSLEDLDIQAPSQEPFESYADYDGRFKATGLILTPEIAKDIRIPEVGPVTESVSEDSSKSSSMRAYAAFSKVFSKTKLGFYNRLAGLNIQRAFAAAWTSEDGLVPTTERKRMASVVAEKREEVSGSKAMRKRRNALNSEAVVVAIETYIREMRRRAPG